MVEASIPKQDLQQHLISGNLSRRTKVFFCNCSCRKPTEKKSINDKCSCLFIIDVY